MHPDDQHLQSAEGLCVGDCKIFHWTSTLFECSKLTDMPSKPASMQAYDACAHQACLPECRTFTRALMALQNGFLSQPAWPSFNIVCSLQAFYLPFAFATIDLVAGGNWISSLMGILAGHL